jgi:hypothetical protein
VKVRVLLLFAVATVIVAACSPAKAQERQRVEEQVEARLGESVNASCSGEGDYWVRDLIDEKTYRDYSGCVVRLDGNGRIKSRVERCRLL